MNNNDVDCVTDYPIVSGHSHTCCTGMGWDGMGCTLLVTQFISLEAFTHKLWCFYQRATTSKLEPISDQYKLICMSSQYVTDNISTSSSSSAILMLMNIHVLEYNTAQSSSIAEDCNTQCSPF